MNATEERGKGLTGQQVVAAVRWRFRICSYLFRLAFIWIVVGYAGMVFLKTEEVFTTIAVTGFGIFSSAFALTLAIYRCPVCDKFIRRFRPNKEHCGSCGTKIR